MIDKSQSTLMRGFAIVEYVVSADRPLSSAYLAEALTLPKATVHRICQQLAAAGLLAREPDGKRFLGGSRLRKMALATLSNAVLGAHRHAILKALSDEVGETVNLTVMQGSEIVYLERVETNWPYRIHLPVGSRLPLHCTATGKLFLAYLPRARRDKLIGSLSLTAHTPNSITRREPLLEQLQDIARAGVGLDCGEYLEDLISIAVPVLDEDRAMYLALAVHAPAARKSLHELRQYFPAMRRAAGQLAAADGAAA